MKEGWEIKKLGEVCKVVAGQSPEGKFYNSEENGMPFYQGKKEYGEKYIGEPTKWTTKVTKEAEAGDILMSVRAPVGPVNFATQQICIGRGLAAIRAGKTVDREYLYNFLVHHENEIEGNTGAVFNSINKKQIENIQILLPPLPEQQRIVSILDEAFAAIDKAKANAVQNLKNAKELFESYLQGVFRNGDWETKSIEAVCDEIFAGGDAPKDNYSKEPNEKHNIPIYANAVKDRGLYGYTDFARVTKPCVTIAARGSGTGHTELRTEQFLPIVRLIVCIPNSELISTEFLKYTIDNLVIQRSGSAIPQLTVPMIKDYQIPVPSVGEQRQLIEQAETLRAETQKLEAVYQKKMGDLEELKKSILQKAFAGELETEKAIAV
jgi:type I restriction enzyme S subunit